MESTLERVPGDARLVAYLKTVRDAQKAAALEEMRRAATGQAHELIRTEDFTGAIRVLETALQRAGQSPELVDLLQFARAQQAEQEQQQQLTMHLEQAEELAASGDFAGTKAEAEKLLALDPDHKRALQLLEWAKQKLAEQERKKLLDQQLGDIQEAIAAGDIDRALRLADACLQEFPDNSQAAELRAQAARQGEIQKERLYVEDQLEAAKDSISKSDFPAAIAILEGTLERVPGDAGLMAYLRTVRSAQKVAEVQEVRRVAAGRAQELINAKDFAGAIRVLETTFQSVGLSPELMDFLKHARLQQAQWQRQEQVRQVLVQAQAWLGEENFEEAIRLLEQSQKESSAKEITEALSGAQDQLRRYEQQREETLQQALQLLQAGDPAKALTFLDAAPKAYFKDPRFGRTYSRCQEELSWVSAVRQTAEQVEKNLAGEKFDEAEQLLRTALGTYPGDPTLLAARQKIEEARAAAQRRRLVMKLEEARLAFGRKQYREVEELLSSPDWQAGGFSDLAQQAATLIEEARQREREIAQQQTIIQPVQPVPPPPSAPANPAALLEAQEQLREALQASPPRREKEALRAEAARVGGSPAMAPAEAPPRPPAPRATAPAPPKPPPTPPTPAPAPAKPAAAVPVAPAAAARVPKVLAVPPKRTPVAFWVGIGVAVVAIAAAVAWWGLRAGNSKVVGYAQITAVPWAEVVSVKTKGGQVLNVKGETPLQLELPPGDYIIQLQNDQGSGQTEVGIKSGEIVPVKYTFPQVNVDAWVDKLVSK